jgi:drug/metabolite transporter (DMT)-like permease
MCYSIANENYFHIIIKIVFSALIGIIFFNEMLDPLSIFGGSVIIAAGFINFYAARIRKSQKTVKSNNVATKKAAANIY